ncbi:MAG: hypothetical protein HZA83_00695 [Thaumarchaeota archaeon]|nr:hypothetical protein [Nitrososphaerota archaeon]
MQEEEEPQEKSEESQQCPICGKLMSAIRGSKQAVCRKCGYKEDCC